MIHVARAGVDGLYVWTCFVFWSLQGEVGHINKTLVTTYTNMTDLVDAMFPPIIAPHTVSIGVGRRLGAWSGRLGWQPLLVVQCMHLQREGWCVCPHPAVTLFAVPWLRASQGHRRAV